jgi:hypothetical protein
LSSERRCPVCKSTNTELPPAPVTWRWMRCCLRRRFYHISPQLSPGPTYYDILRHITTYYDILRHITTYPTCHVIRHIRHVRHAQVAPRCCGFVKACHTLSSDMSDISDITEMSDMSDIPYTQHTYRHPPPSSYFKTQSTEYALAYDMIILRS